MVRSLGFAFVALAAVISAATPSRAEGVSMDLLMLQATARIGVALAAGNYCAGVELRPLIETTAHYLAGANAPAAADRDLIAETRSLLDAAIYDTAFCDQPCTTLPAAAAGTGTEPFTPQATSSYLAAFDAVVSRWLAAAEHDPPTLTISTARHSYDPLPRYAPGDAVAYQVHVGPACHGAVLWLDRPYALPSAFDGSGSFVPPHDGLWTVDLMRRDGLALSPLTYLDAAGLPSYIKEFWVGAKPATGLGPGSLSPWHKRP